MSDNKKYYYLKLKDNFFDSEEIKILESMPNGVYYSNLLIKLYLKSLKVNGALRFNDFIPYDEQMIATITNLNIDVVRSGLTVLSSIKLIERLEDGTIYMMNIQSFIGKSNSEADRKRLYRAKIEEEKLALEIGKEEGIAGQMSEKCPDIEGTFTEGAKDRYPPEIENKDKATIIDRIKDNEIENIDEEEVTAQSIKLLRYFEKVTGSIGGISFVAIRAAVVLHGGENVKRAIDKALEKNKPSIIYINGILRNWAKEGYPKEGEREGYGIKGNNFDEKCNSNDHGGFRPKEPRVLTEEERRSLEGELI